VDAFLTELRNTSPWEAVAAVLGLMYLLLAVRMSLLCWLCAFVSTSIYLVIFARASLYMQVALQVFYLAMAVYGFINWRRGRADDGEIAIRVWPWRYHVTILAFVVVAAAINGWILTSRTQAAQPYLDSLVTWGSVVTTWMVARRMLENWLYWIVFDGLATALYYQQQLLATTALFILYIGIVIRGYFRWRAEYRVQLSGVPQHASG
jgi:nicotinamide mononucleotide transporter